MKAIFPPKGPGVITVMNQVKVSSSAFPKVLVLSRESDYGSSDDEHSRFHDGFYLSGNGNHYDEGVLFNNLC